MPTSFERSDEVREVAEELMETVKMHEPLRVAKIAYLIRKSSTFWTSKGKMVLAQVSKPSPVDNFLTGFDLVLTVDEYAWKHADKAQRKAMLDHELSHCETTEAGGFTIVAHDLEEFVGVVRRHGLWREEIKNLVSAAEEHGYDRQHHLPFTPAPKMGGTTVQPGETMSIKLREDADPQMIISRIDGTQEKVKVKPVVTIRPDEIA